MAIECVLELCPYLEVIDDERITLKPIRQVLLRKLLIKQFIKLTVMISLVLVY